ncbi:PAS domain S-box protein [Streptomyces sp. NPDC088254]|uniref:PAS domain S-box protein n=1 Tax=Streptomyces sp. NPDC088254 TaxID=3365847 RepID=UPI003815D0DB
MPRRRRRARNSAASCVSKTASQRPGPWVTDRRLASSCCRFLFRCPGTGPPWPNGAAGTSSPVRTRAATADVPAAGEIIGWTPGVEELLGYAPEEVVGRSGAFLFAGSEDRARTARILQRCRTGPGWSGATTACRRDGRTMTANRPPPRCSRAGPRSPRPREAARETGEPRIDGIHSKMEATQVGLTRRAECRFSGLLSSGI